MRYVDADKLLEYIGTTERCGDCPYYENDIECRSHSLSRQDICNIVEDLVEESADVQPVVKGEWVMINEQLAKCSVCGGYESTNGKDKTMAGVIFKTQKKYCPHCGADMRGDNNDDQ